MKNTLLIFCFAILSLISACRNGGAKQPKEDINTTNKTTAASTKSLKDLTINVYIENSGSMDGYIKEPSAFKGAIRDLLVLLKYECDNVKIFFINSDVHSTATSSDLAVFAQNINTLWFVGDRTHSKLNNIFNQVLERTNNQTISILFSDYIYSIAGRNTRDLLNDEKSLTKDAFLTKWKKTNVQLSTTIVKMKSNFDGKYFPYTGDKDGFRICMERPYYICVIGNQELLNDFNQKIELKAGKIEGFENKYVLSSEDPKGIYYSILNSSFNNGRFNIDRDNSQRDYTHGIKDVKTLRGSDTLTFAIAVDFSMVKSENDYICNPNNYSVTTDNFKVAKVFSLNQRELNLSDWNTIKDHKPTHVILLKSIVKKLNDSEISFVLKKQIPQWVANSNSEDDTDKSKLSGKTFGLKYWVEGISEAYEIIYPDNRNYFECTLTIK